jgi:alpha-1,3-mannosyltransferase
VKFFLIDTEIDWKAYMQEVEGFMSGELDYYKLKGDTGPLVYPAGFVYLYAGLHKITEGGTNIYAAQWIFWAVYLVFIGILHRIYLAAAKDLQISSVQTSLMLVCLSASRRIHSLFVLRLFNDCFAMLLLFFAVLMFIRNRWMIGCVIYSLAVSIKMNVLLFAPGLLALLLARFSVDIVIRHLVACAMVQYILALPFITSFPFSYLHRAFEFGRAFMYKWSVNWKMLPEEFFLSKTFAISLLAVHLSLLILLAWKRWSKCLGLSLNSLFSGSKFASKSSYHILAVLFSSNFIGILCSRSLHYQFYVWYYHTIPFFLFARKSSILQNTLSIILLIFMELCWNIYPANYYSSFILLAVHIILVILIFTLPVWNNNSAKKKKEN